MSRVLVQVLFHRPKLGTRNASWLPNPIKRLFKPPKVRQIGDPVLRAPCLHVQPEIFQTREFQMVVETMIKIMRLRRSTGIAAPQIGVNLRVFAAELTEEQVEETRRSLQAQGADVEEEMSRREIKPFPLKVFINPELKVLDSKMVAFREDCSSMEGFSAVVPRALQVDVRGVNEKFEPAHWIARGWAARIAQHEFEHLKGNLFIDTMLYKSLASHNWQEAADS